jgi:hypothetical protein
MPPIMARSRPPSPPWDTVARLTSEPDRSSIEATPFPAGKRRRNGCTCPRRRALPAHAIGARVEEIECSPELDASAGRSHREAQPLSEQPASRRAPPHGSPPRPRRGPDRKSRVAGVRFRDASKPRASRPSLEDRGGGHRCRRRSSRRRCRCAGRARTRRCARPACRTPSSRRGSRRRGWQIVPATATKRKRVTVALPTNSVTRVKPIGEEYPDWA